MLRTKGLLTTLLLIVLIACTDSPWDEVPTKIADFVSNYYPMSGISDYSETDDIYKVTVRGGSTITFDSNYNWLTFNGNGSTLPVMFITDRMPEVVVRYLTELEALDKVYAAYNDPRTITLQMLNYKLEYTKSTETIKQIE